MNNLLNNVEFVSVLDAAVAGTSALTTSVVDMAGWTGVVFVAKLGDVTTGSDLGFKAQESDVSDSGFVDIDGDLSYTAGATDADHKLLALDLVRPTKQYVQAVLSRATQNAVVDGIWAVKYGPLHVPVVQGSTVLASATLPNADVA